METSNDLRHTIDVNDKTGNYRIKIRLNDECRNGHEDFSVTADFWEIGRARTDGNMIGCGCMHDDILKVQPDLAQFIDLHLCDFNGAPMYPEANGYYHLKNSSKDVVMEHLRISPSEFTTISKAEDKEHLKLMIIEMGVDKRWKREAIEAIHRLEELTGKKFESKATKQHFTPFTPEEKITMDARMKTGYYCAEKIAERNRLKRMAAKQKLIDKINRYADDEIHDLNQERIVKLYFAERDISIDNMIYYKNSNKIVFNWTEPQYASCRHQMPVEEFDRVYNSIEWGKLPENVTVELGYDYTTGKKISKQY